MIANSIQWFPGHMHKAQKEIAEAMPKVDVIIEVLDARIPFSSENPLLAKLRQDKPCVKVLNKRDLADPVVTAEWIEYLEQERDVKAIAITTSEPCEVRKIIDLCRKLAPQRTGSDKQIRTMIMGIPNVGKSTIINSLAGRVIAKTGNQPAVTRSQQRIKLDDGMVLSDTPGVLWPKVENPHSGFRLAATGAIKDTAMEYDDVGFYTIEYLIKAYPENLKDRYKLEHLGEDALENIELIGNKRGCLGAGGRVDLHKTSVILINELRAGTLGQITLERPSMITAEVKAAQIAAEEKTANKIKKKEQRRKRYLKNKR